MKKLILIVLLFLAGCGPVVYRPAPPPPPTYGPAGLSISYYLWLEYYNYYYNRPYVRTYYQYRPIRVVQPRTRNRTNVYKEKPTRVRNNIPRRSVVRNRPITRTSPRTRPPRVVRKKSGG